MEESGIGLVAGYIYSAPYETPGERLVLLKEFVENQADEPESVSAVLSWYWNQSLDKIQFDRIERKIAHSSRTSSRAWSGGSPARIAWS